jgi:hypothetical protein
MVFKHYCAVFLNPNENLNKEVTKISEGPIRVMRGKGITLCTFTSVVDVRVLDEYFKSYELNFLLFELDDNTSAFNFNDKDKENNLFGFMSDINKYKDFEDISNKLLDDIVNDNIFDKGNYYSGITNSPDKYHHRLNKTSKNYYTDDEYINEEIKDLTKSEINEKVNNIIDKGLHNLTEYDKKMLEKLSSLM